MNYEFKGTGGIWKTRIETDKEYDQPIITIFPESGSVDDLATIWTGLDIGDEIDETTIADAVLIRKAPELFEELKHCVSALEVFDTEGTRLITNRVKQLLKDATTLLNE